MLPISIHCTFKFVAYCLTSEWCKTKTLDSVISDWSCASQVFIFQTPIEVWPKGSGSERWSHGLIWSSLLECWLLTFDPQLHDPALQQSHCIVVKRAAGWIIRGMVEDLRGQQEHWGVTAPWWGRLIPSGASQHKLNLYTFLLSSMKNMTSATTLIPQVYHETLPRVELDKTAPFYTSEDLC